MSRFARLFGLAGLPGLLAISACAAGPDYHAPQPAVLGVPPRYSVPSDQTAQDSRNSRWWDAFSDPEFTRLEAEGLKANLDIAMALSRLRQSREALVQARSGNVPTVSASAGYSRTQAITGPVGATLSASSLSLAGDASYQLDIFGGRRRSIEAARADAEASGFDYAAVALSIQSEIANAYLQVRLQQANLANARLSQANQADNLQIAGWRNQAGLIGSLDVEQARTQLAQTAAVIPQVESSLNLSMARLGVLLGRDPGALKVELKTPMPIPTGPAAIAVGIPADVLRQRPDVRSAERSLAAATARIGVATAQLYPALSLGGNIGTVAGSFRTLFDVISGQAFANIAQTIWDGGRLRSVVRAQRAATDGVFFSYKQIVLRALEDTENAIVALRSANQRHVQYAAALDAATSSATIARLQYRSGLIDYPALLTSENQLISSRNGLVQARYDRAAALVQLYAALGGGWDAQGAVYGQDK
jgi:multidrug efflux system outer membrane protein